jgi:peptide/nickel transport system substrate-binding protein
MQIFARLQQILKDQAGYVYLYQQQDLYGARDSLEWYANVGGPVFMWNASKR